MEERKIDKKVIIIILLLVLVAFLIYKLKIGEIDYYQNPVPTGNVDVFDIGLQCCWCNDDDDNPVPGVPDLVPDKGNNKGNGEGTKPIVNPDLPIYDEETDAHEIDKIFVDDKNGDYIYQQNLEIFNNATYEYTNKIAPGVSNTYQFVVHNSSDQNLNYYVEMYEITEYKVNLKYRLKKNGEYVVGSSSHWVSASDLKTAMARINSGVSDKYTLDWKWFDDDVNDTIAGKSMTDTYKLNIRFRFETIGD